MTDEPYDFAVCKNCGTRTAYAKYRLRRGRVWACRRCDLHYIDYLDPDVSFDGSVDPEALTPRRREYLEKRHINNPERFRRHFAIVRQHAPLPGLRVLDVGCGGGLFLSMINEAGGHGVGAELWDPAILYASGTFGVTVHKYPVEHAFWSNQYQNQFDAVTLWDVIEHVNFPLETLRAAWGLLRDGGLLFIGTPCRDAFFHRFGGFTYRLSAGRFPTLLNMLYSTQAFGHKQIISTAGMQDMLYRSGFETLHAEKICELSFPCEFYLLKYFRSRTLARILGPPAGALIAMIRVRNKMIVVGRKAQPRPGPSG